MIKIERIITPDGFNPDANLTSQGHTVSICRTEHSEKWYGLTNRGSLENPDYQLQEKAIVDRETETGTIACSCGSKLDTEDQALQHLKDVEETEKGSLKTKVAREQFTGVKLHGFKYAGFEAHNQNIVFCHEELGLKIYATPNWQEDQTIHVQVEGRHDTTLRPPLQGQVVDVLNTSEHLTVGEYLRHLRDFIEENLLSKSRREELGIEEEQ